MWRSSLSHSSITFTDMEAGWVGGCSGGSGDRLAEIGKHSWGHSAGGSAAQRPLHTFISVFAQGMWSNLHTRISVRRLLKSTTGWGENDPSTVGPALLIPPRLNFNAHFFIKAYKGHLWICLCVWLIPSVGGMALMIYTTFLIIIFPFF